MGPDFNRYRGLMTNLARQCLDRSAGAPVLAQSRGWPICVGAPAARVLLGEPVAAEELDAGFEALSQAGRSSAAVRFNDTFGFSRRVYHPLLVHLHRRATRLLTPLPPPRGERLGEGGAHAGHDHEHRPTAGTLEHSGAPGAPSPSPSREEGGEQDIALTLWWALCRYEQGAPGDADAARRIVQPIIDHPGPDGALHPRDDDDQLDAWTYRELTGLHALARLAMLDRNAPWWERVEQVALHHQAFTQPDYTTYQPWGVFAFLALPDTRLFGEQQLHDTETNLHVETPGAGLLAGLLLADAADAMDREKIA